MSQLDDNDIPLSAVPGLVRIAASVWWRTTEWTVNTSLRAGTRLVRGAMNGESPAELLQATGVDLRDYARRLLQITDSERSSNGSFPEQLETARRPQEGSVADLRKRGEELLRRSADVTYSEDAHPAYGRILGELAPDEGRILRLLALEGPQPSVDVRTAPPLGIGSQLTAPGLNMIGAEAGCRHLERVPAYMNNLYRLGLVWFSREPVPDQLRYQVLEAQPEVHEAMHKAGRARTVRRSIHLTPFGHDFCDTCLPLHTAELDLLPGAGTQDTPIVPPPRT
jgi:abortive infection alpha-like protein